ncbi:MerR family transcriptional regulator [Streptomyces sp. XM4193]|nr:MerR family transcriptional regulator [Streptomyces sp. XM4193]MCK1796811.1 MerR family transcriptional regulator [Streptomyces sp. XM4193]
MAEAAGITPRTLRFYRERRLLPPPRREGRIAWYDERHLARLHTIAGLLARGHTLGGIAELIVAFEKGRDSDSAAELLGVSRALAPRFSEETTVRLTPEQLAALFPEEDTPENLSTAIELGYLSIEGDEITHISQRLLDASTMLVDRGVPLSAVLEAGRRMRRHVEAISADFAGLIKEHLLTEGRFEDISDAIEALRPSAKQVVEAELSMAMDRQLRREIEEFFNLPEERRGPSEGDARD